MKKNRWVLRAVSLVLASVLLHSTVIVAGATAGSGDDPLVTLSYLNNTFLNAILEKVDQKIADRNGQIVQQLAGQGVTGGQTAASFTVVSLTKGQVLTGEIGCEVLLRVGTAVCVSPSSPGLGDETTAGTLNNGGALVQNHLYLMTIEGRGLKATAADTKLLVRGSYSIG